MRTKETEEIAWATTYVMLFENVALFVESSEVFLYNEKS